MLPTKHPTGFTLLELIIVIAIVAITLSFAVPGWNMLANKGQHRAILENYHGLFAFARWSAASQRKLVTVCPLSDKQQCVDNWELPVAVFIDEDKDKQPDDGRILRQFSHGNSSFTLRSRTGGRGYFRFNENGMAHGSPGSLVLCPNEIDSGTMTYMPVNMAGRFRVEYDNNADGVIRLRWGATITC